MTSGERQVVPGISISREGQATVDPGVADILFDLAIKLEESTKFPVDVQHVLAAIILSVRQQKLAPDTKLSADDSSLTTVLTPCVQSIFRDHDGKVGRDD